MRLRHGLVLAAVVAFGLGLAARSARSEFAPPQGTPTVGALGPTNSPWSKVLTNGSSSGGTNPLLTYNDRYAYDGGSGADTWMAHVAGYQGIVEWQNGDGYMEHDFVVDDHPANWNANLAGGAVFLALNGNPGPAGTASCGIVANSSGAGSASPYLLMGTVGGIGSVDSSTSGVALMTQDRVRTWLTPTGTEFRLSGPTALTWGSGTWPIGGVVSGNAADTGLSRAAAGVVEVGNGSFGDASGTLKCASIILTGTETGPNVSGVDDFRLTLLTGTPVTTTDQSGVGTLFCCPYKGNRIALWSGTAWVLETSAQFSISVTATSGKNYDVWCFDSSGTPTLETLVWTNDTTRGTALAYQNGVLVKSGDATRRYLGTFRASGTNTIDDTNAKRFLWNYYNRVTRMAYGLDAGTWNTNNTTYVAADSGNAAWKREFLLGVDEEDVVADAALACQTTTAGGGIGIAVDGTTTPDAQSTLGVNTQANVFANISCHYESVGLAAGYHYVQLVTGSNSGANVAWYGTVSLGNYSSNGGIYLRLVE